MYPALLIKRAKFNKKDNSQDFIMRKNVLPLFISRAVLLPTIQLNGLQYTTDNPDNKENK